MPNKYNDAQSRITKESIFTALMILMDKKNFTDISITEVAKKAGVSRMAFYRNYNILEDVIGIHLDELFLEYSNHLLNNPDLDNYEITRLFFYYFRKHKTLVTNLINSNLSNLIYERSVEFLYSYSRSITHNCKCAPEVERYNISFISGGFYHVLIEWIKGGMNESDEVMSTMVFERIIKV